MEMDGQSDIIRRHSESNENVELGLVEVVIHPHRKALVAEQPGLLCECEDIYN